jgi:hypothetical protein
MADIEIMWPEKTDTAPLMDAVQLFDGSGVEAECLLQPVRRGLPLEVLVMIASPTLEPFLKALFEKIGNDAYDAVKTFVGRLLSRKKGDADKADESKAPSAVVFESRATGAQFVFTRGLPDEAFRAAIAVDPGTAPGRWTWDSMARKWLRFEDVAT